MTENSLVAPTKEAFTPTPQPLSEKRVLVVDDDKIARKTLSQLLNKLQYEVQTAAGGREALRLLEQQDEKHQLTLLLVDVMMPEMNGIELLRILKQASKHDIPIIMVSSSEDPDTIKQCFSAGAEDFLQKPIQLEMLKRRIEMCIEDRSRLNNENVIKKVLEEARARSLKLSEEVEEQQKELEKIKTQVTNTIETPMQVVMKSISELMTGNYSIEHYKTALVAILKSLGTRDLYTPAFNALLEDDQLDETTKKWLMSEFINDESKLSYSKKITQQQPMSSPEHAKLSQHSFSKTLTGTRVDDVHKFDFCAHSYSVAQMVDFIVYMFDDLQLFQQFNIDKQRLLYFLEKLRTLYKSNPYHNFVHVMDVTQFAYSCLKVEKVATLLSPLDKLSVMVAALMHDLEHPGLNNNYQINAQTALALTYNDLSVLENHHAAKGFQLLNESAYNFLSALSNDDYKEVRRNVVSLILATDMSQHFELLTKFQTRTQTGQLSKDSKDDRQQLMNIILKCADISNVVRPFRIAKRWANLLIQEFCQQGDLERQQGMPISPLMDRNDLNKLKMQINFMDYIAGPLFKALGLCIPDLRPLYEEMGKNRAKYTTALEMGEDLNDDLDGNANITERAETMSEKSEDNAQQAPHDIEPANTNEMDGSIAPVVWDVDPEKTAKIKGFSVLIVENDKSCREAIEKLLSSTGFTWKATEDGDSGFAELEKGNFDIVIVSFDLPKHGAPNFCNRVRNGAAFMKAIPIVGLTSSSTRSENEKIGASFSVFTFIVKPFTASNLLSVIEHLVELALRNSPPVDMPLALDLCGGEESFVVELLGDFLSNGKEQLDAMRNGIEGLHYDVVQLNSHSMKGGAAQLAAKPISQAAFVLEKASRSRKPKAEMQEALKHIEERFAEVQQFVSKITQS